MQLRRFAPVFLAAAVLCLVGSARQDDAPPAGLTFFGWSDQHVLPDGDYTHCSSSVEAMKALPGTPFPDSIGGTVEEPSFVVSAGDLTEWPSHAATEGYRKLAELLPWPSYEIAGNHDDGGDVPSDTLLDFLREKHGGLDYEFGAGGVHFVCLFTTLERGATFPEGPVFEPTLAWLREHLDKVPAGQPVIVVMHHCADSLTNKDAVLEALSGHNVLAVLGGHYHKAALQVLGGIPFYELPSPKSDRPAVTVVRVTSDRLTLCTWDRTDSKWLDKPVYNETVRGRP